MSNCNTKLRRIRHVLARLENGCSQMELDLNENDGGLEVQVSPAIDPEVEMIERDVARSTITKLQAVAGKISGSAKFTHEFKGNGAGNDVTPKVGQYLEACSMGKRDVYSVGVGSFTLDVSNTDGYLPVNAYLYVSGGARIEARLVIPVDDEERRSKAYYETMDGNAPSLADATTYDIKSKDGSVVYGTLTTNTVESSIVGKAYYPISTSQKSMTIRVEEEGYQRTIYGAMGNFSINAENSNFAKFEFDFMGIVPDGYLVNATGTGAIANGKVYLLSADGGTTFKAVKLVARRDVTFTAETKEFWFEFLEGSKADFADSDAVYLQTEGTPTDTGLTLSDVALSYKAGFGDHPMNQNVVYPQTAPPTLRDAHLLFKEDGKAPYFPAFSEVGVESGNEVALRQSGNSADRGFVNAIINARMPKANVDPEFMSEADYDYFGLWFNGQPVEFEFQLDNGEENNRLYFYAKKLQHTAGSDSERDGVTTLGAEGYLVGDTDDQDDEYRMVFY